MVTFKEATQVRANIATYFCNSALKWYTSELNDFDHNVLNNKSGMKSWISILSNYFKMPISVAFDLLSDKIYSFNDIQT